VLVLDGGAVTHFAQRSDDALATIKRLRGHGIWPPCVPAPVLVECLTGDERRDVLANRLLKSCQVIERVPVRLARRAAGIRTQAGRGSAVDALVVAVAEPRGVVLTGDLRDLTALAAYSDGVMVERF